MSSSSTLARWPGAPQLSAEQVSALLQPNTAVVWPGQASFNTIQAAINSITDASLDQQYQIFIGPGTYTEQVTLKPYVYLMGAGSDQTTITYSGTTSATAAVVQASSFSALQNLTVYCTGGPGFVYSLALYCAGANPFSCDGVVLQADDSGGGPDASNVVFAVSNDYNANALNQITIGDAMILATANGWGSGARGIDGMSGATYDIHNAQITATRNMQSSNGQAWGVLAGEQATIQLTACNVSGDDYAINLIDGSATAIDCTLSGTVADGVQVINTASAAA